MLNSLLWLGLVCLKEEKVVCDLFCAGIKWKLLKLESAFGWGGVKRYWSNAHLCFSSPLSDWVCASPWWDFWWAKGQSKHVISQTNVLEGFCSGFPCSAGSVPFWQAPGRACAAKHACVVGWQSAGQQPRRLVAVLPLLRLPHSQPLREESCWSLVQEESLEDNVMLSVFNEGENERNYKSVRCTSVPGTSNQMDDLHAFRK